jgi:hypothetical protein
MTEIADPPAGITESAVRVLEDIEDRLQGLENSCKVLHEEVCEILRMHLEQASLLERFRPLIDKWAAKLPAPGIPAGARPRLGRGRAGG